MTKEEYRKYLLSPQWKEFRLKFTTSKPLPKCIVCEDTKKLDVHHVSYDNLGSEKFTDVMLFCRRCHYKFHKLNKIDIYKDRDLLLKTIKFINKNKKTEKKQKKDYRKTWDPRLPKKLRKFNKAIEKEKRFSCESRYSKKKFYRGVPI